MAEKLRIARLVVGPIETNCYIVRDGGEGREAVLVDPGDDAEEILAALKELQAEPVAVLLTHGHYDHILAVNALKRHFPDCPVLVCGSERGMMEDPSLNSPFQGAHDPVTPDRYLADGERLRLLGREVRVLSTPGHTAGSACFYFADDGVLFSGDTLFYRGMGRTDLPTGDRRALYDSLCRLFAELPDNTEVYPGHGRETAIGYERGIEDYLR